MLNKSYESDQDWEDNIMAFLEESVMIAFKHKRNLQIQKELGYDIEDLALKREIRLKKILRAPVKHKYCKTFAS
jgi:hypothetical protein